MTTGAFVLMDDEGRILAMAGGYDYARNEYNVVYQGQRQPGSSFKPFVYSAALATGTISPSDSISNEQLLIDTPGGGKKKWPKNGRARYGGRVSVRTAIASSINVPAVRVCEMVTPRVAAMYARDTFGFRSHIEPVLSMALGSNAVSPLEMAQAYSVFMNYGDRATPFGITRVVGPNGEVVKEVGPDIKRGVLSPSVCAAMDEFLRAVVTSGTATKARVIEDARGKTGTTSDNRDAWFCGYTNNLVGIGWIANEKKENGKWVYDTMQSSVFGGTVTVEIWTGVMKEAVKRFGRKESRRPQDLDPLPSTRQEPEPVAPPVDDVTGGDTPEPPPDITPEMTPPTNPDGTLPVSEGQGTPGGGGTTPAVVPPNPERGPREPGRRPPRDPELELVTVEICADSGQIANRYCPETVTRRLPRSDAPKGRCTMHGPQA